LSEAKPVALIRIAIPDCATPIRATALARTAEFVEPDQSDSTYLIGWRGYFGFCETPSVLRELDQWIRRRLRAVVWKQWRRGPTRFAELRRRGVGRDQAAQAAGSPRGPWRISISPALSIALSNAFFTSLGLATVTVPNAA
jgi:RNA-directed DNA polymerase